MPASPSSRAWGLAGLSAAAAGAVGTAVGLTRAREARVTDRYADERFDLLRSDRGSVVAADDGVPLSVREVGPRDAPLTVVFVHGFCNRMAAWHFQRIALERTWGDRIRMVFYDHRGHGQSGPAPSETCTIAQLARDLDAVLRAMVPTGPVVLVGHSMGGMTVLSYAGQHPETSGPRVVGFGLISTAAGGLSEVGLGRSLESPAIDAFRAVSRRVPGMVQGGRGATRRLIAPLLRAASYGDRKVSRSVVRFTDEMINDTPLSTLVDFLQALEDHDESAALPAMTDVPALVLCGDGDILTPFRNSVSLAEQLPLAELLRVPGAGHMVQLEQPEVVSEAIDRLVTRAVEAMSTEPAMKERATGVLRAIADRRRHGELWPALGGRTRRR
ncbi:alpha/beta fold hydrolase [Speluncibacter jeojiensis]|uniref:Alpha/beta hydrolase n=1 Tax=Speluncibacter jeojiensis TaxID=2710754 RepID=A0A9X4M002_9ACTN|nr:alpha/beta hydrolase [Rhodococcus sp. D2-41]MDG3015493.1 alpha/beta hydrolase [Corynebacteriales bacterium D3-21]